MRVEIKQVRDRIETSDGWIHIQDAWQGIIDSWLYQQVQILQDEDASPVTLVYVVNLINLFWE